MLAMAKLPAPAPTSSSCSSIAAANELPARSCFSATPLPSFLRLTPRTLRINKPSSIAVVAAPAEPVHHEQRQHLWQEGDEQAQRGSSSAAGAATKWQKKKKKKKMVPYSRRPSFEYFSGHVKKHRHLPPRNPSHLLGTRRGVGSRNAQQNATSMAKIIEKLRRISEADESGQAEVFIQEGEEEEEEEDYDDDEEDEEKEGSGNEDGATLPLGEQHSAGELCLPKPQTDLFSLGIFRNTPEDHDVQNLFPWEHGRSRSEEKVEAEERNWRRLNAPSLAEIIIPRRQLKRLQTLGIPLEGAVKIGRLGVTGNIAQSIMQRWRRSELVKVKCKGPAAENMLKIHSDLERKTGGLVIWRSGSVAVVYRGTDFDIANNASSSLERLEGLLTQGKNRKLTDAGLDETCETDTTVETDDETAILGSNRNFFDSHSKPRVMHKDINVTVQGKDAASYKGNVLGITHQLSTLNVRPNPFLEREHEMEIAQILESVGPRYKEWKRGLQPAPVDADLLPLEVAGYRPPYRLLPYGIEPKLTNHEQTNLRRLIRHIPPHFISGRSSGLQGLAAGIVKLWQKSEVVKIAMKENIQDMDSEMMADELKRLTGGELLARDKYYITLYRGKDFLPRQVASALKERLKRLSTWKVGQDVLRDHKGTGIQMNKSDALGEQQETENLFSTERKALDSDRVLLMHSLEEKLATAMRKKEGAQQELKNFEHMFIPVNQRTETETITEEEKCVLRERGLEMSAFFLLGKRGIFYGVVENMHKQWKHRELVKLIVKGMEQEELQRTARMLEYVSGGILVAVVPTSKGQAIIMYRGKDYEGRWSLQPHNLLTRKEAFKRSAEMQHCVLLSKRIEALESEISQLKATMLGAGELKAEKMEERRETFKLRVGSRFGFENDDDSDSETDDAAEENYFSQLLDSKAESTKQGDDDI